MRNVCLTILALSLFVVFFRVFENQTVDNQLDARQRFLNYRPIASAHHRPIKGSPRFLQSRQFATRLRNRTAADVRQQNIPIQLSARAELWAQNTLPVPHDHAQNAFRAIVALVYDSYEDEDELETRSVAMQFLGEDETLDAYIREVLESLPQHTYQRERNFIYSFARTARPNTSFSEFVMRDFEAAFESQLNLRANDFRQMSDTLMRQPDLTLAEKREILARHDLR